nr:phosphoribosylanthranilate isomerase [Lachnospiraceae bacterium]
RCPVIKAFKIQTEKDAEEAEKSCADYILLDSGAGTGKVFDWELLKDIKRPYFLAGGLNPENVGDAIRLLHPYGVDVSSGLETCGLKDKNKMTAFKEAVGKEEK